MSKHVDPVLLYYDVLKSFLQRSFSLSYIHRSCTITENLVDQTRLFTDRQ